jgi:GT2 family glycosyltransferase
MGEVRGVGGDEVLVIEANSNFGFAGACNLGISQALGLGADYVLLLNNDVVPADDILSQLFEGVRRYPDAGILGGKVFYLDDPDSIWFAGGDILEALMGTRHRGMDHLDAEWSDAPGSVDFVTGTLMLIAARCFERVGNLDQSFFLYFEDVDMCRRCRAMGMAVVYLPGVRCRHEIGGGRRHRLTARYLYYVTRNRLLEFSKGRGPVGRAYVVAVCTLVFGLIRGALILAGTSGHPRLPLLRSLAIGWWDGVRGKTGERRIRWSVGG